MTPAETNRGEQGVGTLSCSCKGGPGRKASELPTEGGFHEPDIQPSFAEQVRTWGHATSQEKATVSVVIFILSVDYFK